MLQLSPSPCGQAYAASLRHGFGSGSPPSAMRTWDPWGCATRRAAAVDALETRTEITPKLHKITAKTPRISFVVCIFPPKLFGSTKEHARDAQVQSSGARLPLRGSMTRKEMRMLGITTRIRNLIPALAVSQRKSIARSNGEGGNDHVVTCHQGLLSNSGEPPSKCRKRYKDPSFDEKPVLTRLFIITFVIRI